MPLAATPTTNPLVQKVPVHGQVCGMGLKLRNCVWLACACLARK